MGRFGLTMGGAAAALAAVHVNGVQGHTFRVVDGQSPCAR